MLLLVSIFSYSQKEKLPLKAGDEFACVFADEPDPEFPQGIDSLRRFIRSKFAIPEAIVKSEKRIYGTIVVNFKVESNGLLNDFKIVKSIDTTLDAEVIRVFKLIPKWKVYPCTGPVYMRFPVTFDLNAEE